MMQQSDSATSTSKTSTSKTSKPAQPETPAPDPSATFAGLWDAACASYPERPFLCFQDQQDQVSNWTYAQFDQVVTAVAGRLAAAGVGPGDGIHLCLRNCPAFIAIWLAAARIGAWICPVDPSVGAREIGQQLARIDARLGVFGRERAAAYREGAEDFDAQMWELDESADDLRRWLAEAVAPPARPEIAQRDRLAVMFTSGTTSQPKGVVLTQRNYHHIGQAMAQAADLQAEHRWYVTLPLFHGNAQFYCFAPAIAVGASVALTSGFSASRWVADARALRATHASLFAAPIRMILARTPAGTPSAGLDHVWYAQNLGSDHHREFAELAGAKARQLYGMTETGPIVTYDRSPEPVSDLIGLPLDGRTARLVQLPDLSPVPPGEPGMIAVAGTPGDDLFAGYLDDPEVTSRTLVRDPAGTCWLLTGDLAVDTGPGGWRFVGRSDDVIKVAGENVSLTEVEAALAQAPGVLEVAVLPKDDPVRDRVPVAYVVARDAANPPRIEDLDAWAADNLTKAARPREWHLIEKLPRTSVGKVRRFKLATQD